MKDRYEVRAFLPDTKTSDVNVKLDGLDALLSTMQLPPGVPVATVGIDNGKNAALLAARILALSDKKLAEKLGKK